MQDATDRIRPWLIVRALETCHALIADGIDLRGYFHWTLVDNFEWDHGWNSRFGLIELDRSTQQRTIRLSGHLYTRTANANTLAGADRVTFGHPPAPVASATVT